MPNPYEIETPDGTVDLREWVVTPNIYARCRTCGLRAKAVINLGPKAFPLDLCRLCLVAALAAMDAREGVANG